MLTPKINVIQVFFTHKMLREAEVCLYVRQSTWGFCTLDHFAFLLSAFWDTFVSPWPCTGQAVYWIDAFKEIIFGLHTLTHAKKVFHLPWNHVSPTNYTQLLELAFAPQWKVFLITSLECLKLFRHVTIEARLLSLTSRWKKKLSSRYNLGFTACIKFTFLKLKLRQFPTLIHQLIPSK